MSAAARRAARMAELEAITEPHLEELIELAALREKAKPTLISHARLKELLEYHPRSGHFIWRVDRRPRTSAGDLAGYLNKDGHRYIELEGKQYLARRLAIFYVTGQWPTRPLKIGPEHRDDQRWAVLERAQAPA